MALINYEQLQDGDFASANSVNERFASVVKQVNGNIDSQNIKNGSVTREKIANNSINKDKLDMQLYIDDNGWTVTDMGGIKTYSRVVNVDGNEYDGNGNPGAKGLLIGGSGARRDLATFNPPQGRTVEDVAVVGTYFGRYSGHLVVSGEMRSGKILIAGGNIWPHKLSYTGKVYIHATEIV